MDPARPLELLILPLLLTQTAWGTLAPAHTGNNREICLLPPDEGPCRALFRRYHYDRITQSCVQFWYGGCRGNANNFETQEACDNACGMIEKVPKFCRWEVNEEECKEFKEDYFFNLSSMACEKISGGCNRKKNRFPDESTCMGYCAPKKRPSFCYSPKDGGSCSANMTRYYFNSRHKTCETFTFTGCRGNENNFVSMEDCKRSCENALKKEKKKKIPKGFFAIRRPKIQKKL
ncbi:tissue factor pathway inhibitor 2 [Dasypus novemcinctus]|uniref:tissue factor pathway inhibitor 2 n=1 Tax=Dasypus novemcinctus TaxID=9361 RepID=UPI00032888D2|nr:tissue factor pathway inhibitor 2 [Dasypus novemcinctus]